MERNEVLEEKQVQEKQSIKLFSFLNNNKKSLYHDDL